MVKMELNDKKSGESRSVPFDIDLNETPISSPRETLVFSTGEDEVSPLPRSGGGKGKLVLLDINALPTEAEAEAAESVVNSGMHCVRDTSSNGNTNGACSNLLFVGDQCDFMKAPQNVTTVVKSGPVDIVQQRLNFVRNTKEVGKHSLSAGRNLANDFSAHVSFQKQSEKLLQNLREFIFNKRGMLEDGWHVEFFYCPNRCKTFAIYCSPDGNKFESMLDVACHLGLVSNYCSLVPQNKNDGFALTQNRLHSHTIRKESMMFSTTKDLRECQENLKEGIAGKFLFGMENWDAEACKLTGNAKVAQINLEPADFCGSSNFKDGFPIQFEDFFVLSIGDVDPRPSYHCTNQIWPVGFKSTWHDKITGSVFVCEISDGGDCGPVFKVQRYPCSTHSLPTGSTILSRPSVGMDKNTTDNAFGGNNHEDINVQMIFSDLSPPHLDFNICTDVTASVVTQNVRKPSRGSRRLCDDIGEFLVEGRSSSSVWRMVSEKLVHSFHQVYKQTGACKFFCRHASEWWSSCMVYETAETIESTCSLAKFCQMSGPLYIPHHIESNEELATSGEALMKWLAEDRFGLDVDFVQEIIEQLPGVHSCSDYMLLNKRTDRSKLRTVGNGFLLAKKKDDLEHEREMYSTLNSCKNHRKHLPKALCPPGKPLSSKLPAVFIGDVLQSWELLWRFSEVLGLEEPLSFEDLEDELIECCSSSRWKSSASRISGKSQHSLITDEMETLEDAELRQASDDHSSCAGEILSKAHLSLLKILLAELQSKLAGLVDPIEIGESKSRKRKKKDADHSIFARKSMLDSLPINELTWPELARRYLLTISSMESNLDSLEVVSRESCKLFYCLQGYSGAPSGSHPGVAVMEADALLLAEATKQIFGASKNINDLIIMDSSNFVAPSFSNEVKANNDDIPNWAQLLEPVRKLPTNVGARIRRCIYDALDLNPPEWARKILEHSISKEVYKGNASGPTKKAVLSVLADVCGENQQQQKPTSRKRKGKCASSLSEVIMKLCRRVLRCAVADDEEKVFCNLLGRTLLNASDNDDEGLLGFPTMVSRPLDFRTIDLRLAFGAYGGSHEAFLEDVREVWHHIRTAYADQADLAQLAETLSQNFESLYEKEVIAVVQKLTHYAATECLSSEAKKEMEDIVETASEIPKAPWDEGVCKACGVDKDDDNVLLCDKCDSGYHTYCLDPPLARIPEGNWYCPSCINGHCIKQGALQVPQFSSQYVKRRRQGEFTHGAREAVTHLCTSMEVKEYWEYNIEERIFLLKYLVDEVLNNANIRENLEQCASASADLQQKLRSLSTEWRNLKSREEALAGKVAKANTVTPNGIGKLGMEGTATMLPNYLMRQPVNRSTLCLNSTIGLVNLEDGPQNHGSNKFTKQPYWLYANGIPEQHSTSSGNQFMKIIESECQTNQPDLNELHASNPEAIFIKNRISMLRDSITCLDSQLQKVALRKDVLGQDSAGRLYWVFYRPGTSPWVVVDGTTLLQQKSIAEGHRKLLSDSLTLNSSPIGVEFMFKESNAFSPSVTDLSKGGAPGSCQWLSYQSDAEIEELIQWLRDNDPTQRDLIESLLQRVKVGHISSNKTGSSVEEICQPTAMSMNVKKTVKLNALNTNASVALEEKYGPCLELDVNNTQVTWSGDTDERMCRCDCLEPIWPSRHHCHSCHWSFSTKYEIMEHNDGNCSFSRSSKGINVLKEKTILKNELGDSSGKMGKCKSGSRRHEIQFGLAGFPKDFSSPYNLEEVSTKFVVRTSNKELVKEIGLLGSNGIPSFVPSASPYLHDPTLKLEPYWKNEASQGGGSNNVENRSEGAVEGNPVTSNRHLTNAINSPKRFPGGSLYKELEEISRSNIMNDKREVLRFTGSKQRNVLSKIHDSSLRPLVGKGAQILRQLKINLLDMDAALPEEAVKASKAHLEKRCAWRAFVKSAKSVFEMVRATIVFENMIKTDYLKGEWWYWSSISAAAKIATVSALALRIYTLDAAIVYEKLPPISSPKEVAGVGGENSSPNNQKPDGKPVKLPAMDPIANGKPQSRSSKKRNDSEG